MAEVQKHEGTVRKQMKEGLTDTEEMRAIRKSGEVQSLLYRADGETASGTGRRGHAGRGNAR